MNKRNWVIKFLLYFYYRSYQYYGGPIKADGPVSFCVGLNAACVANVVLRLLDAVGILPPGLRPVRAFQIAVDGGFLLLIGVMAGPLLVCEKRRIILKMMGECNKESMEERRRRGRWVLVYVVSSVLLVAGTFL